MKKRFNSLPITMLLLLLFGAAGAYKLISRRDRANDKAAKAKLEEDVSKSLSNIDINMRPLTEAGVIPKTP